MTPSTVLVRCVDWMNGAAATYQAVLKDITYSHNGWRAHDWLLGACGELVCGRCVVC